MKNIEKLAKQPAVKSSKPDDAKGRSGKSAAQVSERAKPENLSPDDLRLLADTMPGEGPGGD